MLFIYLTFMCLFALNLTIKFNLQVTLQSNVIRHNYITALSILQFCKVYIKRC